MRGCATEAMLKVAIMKLKFEYAGRDLQPHSGFGSGTAFFKG